MDLFQIDKSLCKKDGLCMEECPLHLIQMTKEGPIQGPLTQELCIRCGHCLAVCPTGAFSLRDMSPRQCLTITKEQQIDFHQAEQFLRSRRSIRLYKDTPLPRDLLEKAIKTASYAPTGNNYQPVKWLVFEKKDDVREIAGHVIDWMRHMAETQPDIAKRMNMSTLISLWDKGHDRICRDAPNLIFTYASNEFGAAPVDCHNALAYLELILQKLDAGSCWAGYVNFAVAQWQPLKEKLDLPQNHTCHGVLMAGFPKIKYFRAPERKPPQIQYRS